MKDDEASADVEKVSHSPDHSSASESEVSASFAGVDELPRLRPAMDLSLAGASRVPQDSRRNRFEIQVKKNGFRAYGTTGSIALQFARLNRCG